VSYSAIYGSLGGVISTMIFFYLLGVIFVLGAEFNAMLAEGIRARGNGKEP
jgi:membrane protein